MGDRGIYVCRAENVAGTDQDWAIVEVERKCHFYLAIRQNYPQNID